MKSLPLVTVSMVTYNSEKYIQMAIESVLASSYTNFELIISDDCSTDNTWNIIQEYNDKRIIATRNGSNLKEYCNRNKCVDLAKGKYIIFVDGDDILKPLGLEFYVKSLEAFPDCGMSAMAYPYEKFLFPLKLTPREVVRNEIFSTNTFLSMHMLGNLFRTDVLKKNKFPTDKIAGDSYTRWHIALDHPVLLIDGGFAFARNPPGQASEKLTTIECFIQNQSFKKDFFAKAYHKKLISKEELELLIKQYEVCNYYKALSLIKRRHWKDLSLLIGNLKWRIGSRKKINTEILSRDPFKEYSSARLLDRDFFKSPYINKQ